MVPCIVHFRVKEKIVLTIISSNYWLASPVYVYKSLPSCSSLLFVNNVCSSLATKNTSEKKHWVFSRATQILWKTTHMGEEESDSIHSSLKSSSRGIHVFLAARTPIQIRLLHFLRGIFWAFPTMDCETLMS
jgi:hypothetical protein